MSNEPSIIFVLAPRYARDLGAVLATAAVTAEIAVKPAVAAAAFAASTARIAVVDARGTLAVAMVAAHEIGPVVEARQGALIILLARSDGAAVTAAYAAGATQVVVGPLADGELLHALRFAGRTIERLADAVAGYGSLLGGGDAHRDPLTGLANAHHARGFIDLLLDSAKPVGSAPTAIVLLVAVGRFGQINAAYGRSAADALLKSVGERLTRLAGEGGERADSRLVARLAGAEFAVVIPAPVALDDAKRLARRIVDGFEPPFAEGGRLVHLAVRIGIAIGDNEAGGAENGAERLFRRASSALAVARAGTPGGIEIFQPAPGIDPDTRLADLEADLRRAIDADEVEIFYQPQVEIATGRIGGVEALLRWAHPALGRIAAETLLEVAANAEVAAQLGTHIRAKALAEAAAWPPALAGLTLSVNVTAGDLGDAAFGARLDAALDSSGFARARLILEITEGDLIENLDTAAATLAAVRARGTGIALDDFGTGYSSLAYLKSLPLDCLKLDKRLTGDLAGSPRDRIVVRGVVEMARALGIRVVAEGVETTADLDLVVAARCDGYQGYLCSPALPGSDLAAFVAAWDLRRGAQASAAARPST